MSASLSVQVPSARPGELNPTRRSPASRSVSTVAPREPDPKYSRLPTAEQVERAAVHLRRRGFEVVVVETLPDARREALSRIPAGAEVLDGPSRSLEETGIPAALADDARVTLLKPRLRATDRATQSAEIRRLSQAPGVTIGSVHAITEGGEVLVTSGTGSQIGPYAYGAGRVIWVVGIQKIVPPFAEGMNRLEQYSLPLENERARADYGHDSAIARLLLLRAEHPAGRTPVILVN